MYSAHSLRRQMDLLTAMEPDTRLILMGDFNDEPTNRSMTEGLSALNKRRNIQAGDYYNLFYDLHNMEGKGTYNYRGSWNMLDQIIVSYNLLKQPGGLSAGYESGRIFSEDWMMYLSERYGEQLPSATYGGPQYYGGPGDHLPVYVEFSW